MKLELPRGMRDIESEDLAGINLVRDRFFETARLFNFRMMEPSPLEMLSTLEAKSGASISNEIYAFKDKGNRDVALRFDLTIGLSRYIVSRRDLKMPAKIAAFAGVFRYDEPQAGRYRYFHQWDIEVYGPFSQESDAEIIEFVSVFFKKLGLPVSIQVNDRQLVEEFIRSRLGITDEQKVLEMFRAVDKVPKKGAQGVIAEYKDAIDPAKLQKLIDFSNTRGNVRQVAEKADVEGLQGWQKLTGLMDSLATRKVEAEINSGIVRGLDYYSGMVFEVFEASGEGGALVGGGRYDRLTEAFGRKDIGATGAAGGIERIVMALQKHGIVETSAEPLVYVAYATDEIKNKAIEIASVLRNSNIRTDHDMLGRALRKQMDDASTKDAAFVIIVAPSELAENKVTIKSMKEGKESKHNISNLVGDIRNFLKT
ncbi:histidine--tRNA ligase [Candidatus Nitrososphaera sp. FF02]|uniref:histidine--tRNA ligase n=1 Tax=Candidatus Nitrososphaera sp. FF02 TaxID=3398226 RepID=UPI0039E9073A